MADGKWIGDLTPATPLDDAARRVLTVRLEVVREYLPRALRQPDEEIENVHQLRVGTRRARAALDIFVPCLPPRAYKKAKRHLRSLRRAAGDARDWDVFLAGLLEPEKAPTRGQRAGIDFLLGYALGRRVASQAALEKAGKEHPFDLDRFVAETVASVRKADDPELATLLDLARPLLAGLLRELEEAAAGNLDDDHHLHQVRIVGKRLRYALEVLADCFGPPLRERLYPAVAEMQEILGDANDSAVACRLLKDLETRIRLRSPREWKRLRTGFDGLSRRHRTRLARERERFRRWWAAWQESGGGHALLAVLVPERQPVR